MSTERVRNKLKVSCSPKSKEGGRRKTCICTQTKIQSHCLLDSCSTCQTWGLRTRKITSYHRSKLITNRWQIIWLDLDITTASQVKRHKDTVTLASHEVTATLLCEVLCTHSVSLWEEQERREHVLSICILYLRTPELFNKLHVIFENFKAQYYVFLVGGTRKTKNT